MVLPAPVAAEVDYLLGVRFGEVARRAFLSDLAAQRYDVACLEADDCRAVSELDIRYSDLGLGLADCSIVVLAERYETRTPAQLRRAAFPDRYTASGRVIRVAAGGFLVDSSLRSPLQVAQNRCIEPALAVSGTSGRKCPKRRISVPIRAYFRRKRTD